MGEPSVLIMMASYNGEKYIEQQINSIIKQSYKNFKLIIQDDNSSDNTVDIIRKYQEIDERIILWSNEGKNGAYENFHSIINKCKKMEKYDYYMFCDHDDIWNYNKIEFLIDFMEKNNASQKLVMAYADMSIIDENGIIVKQSVNKILKLKYKNKYCTFFNHSIYGCNSILSSKLFFTVPNVNTDSSICHILSHDNYYGKFAAILGELYFINESLMKYRRYSSNVTAAHDYNYGLKKLKMRLKSLNNLAEAHARTYSQSIFTIDKILQFNLSNQDKKKLNNIDKCLKKGGYYALFYAFKYHISCGLLIRTISRYFILFTKVYLKFLNF